MSGAAFLFDLHPNNFVSLQSNTLQKITPFSNYFYGVCIENDPFRAFYGRFLCWHGRWRHNRWRHVVMNFNDVIIIGGQYLIELNSGKGNDICQWILLMHLAIHLWPFTVPRDPCSGHMTQNWPKMIMWFSKLCHFRCYLPLRLEFRSEIFSPQLLVKSLTKIRVPV